MRGSWNALALAVGFWMSALPLAAAAQSSAADASTRMPEGSGPWVVQAYFDNDASLNLLMRRAAPWKADTREGVLTIDVANRYEYRQLLDEGFRVAIDAELTNAFNNPPKRLPNQVNGIPGFTCYRTVDETQAAANTLATNFPSIVEILDIGDSWAKVQNSANGYDLRVIRLTNRSIPGPKPVHFMQGGIHAREYVTSETVVRYAEWLANQYATNADVSTLLDYSEVQVLMFANPDGRKIAEIGTNPNRQQRKNYDTAFCAGATSASSQPGVDMNRNYPFDWAGPGSSSVSCELTFHGPTASSEPESTAIIAHLRNIFPDQRAENPSTPGGDLTTPVSLDTTGIYMDVHSNAARTWYSWGNSSTAAPNSTQLSTLGRKIAFFNGYRPEAGVVGGAIGGATDDFTYGTLGVPAFTIEMDGTDFWPACTTYENSIVQKNLNAFWMASRLTRAPLRLAGGPEILNVSVTPASIDSSGQAAISLTANDARFNNTGGTEPTQAVASVAVYMVPPWQAGATPVASMTATDGAFNSNTETAGWSLPGSMLVAGRQRVWFQATDAAGNKGPVAAAFVTLTESGQILRDGFE